MYDTIRSKILKKSYDLKANGLIVYQRLIEKPFFSFVLNTPIVNQITVISSLHYIDLCYIILLLHFYSKGLKTFYIFIDFCVCILRVLSKILNTITNVILR